LIFLSIVYIYIFLKLLENVVEQTKTRQGTKRFLNETTMGSWSPWPTLREEHSVFPILRNRFV